MPYWTGLAQGFQERRESEYKKNYERELQNRQMSDRVFSYLLNSRDPEMQHLALQGLMQPIGRKKGFKGFMGEMDPAAAPFLSQVVARMNEMVPETGYPAAAPPPPSGAAAMSTNAPVEPGAAPIEGTPMPQEAVLSRPIPEGPEPDASVTAPMLPGDTGPIAGPVGPGPAPVTAMPAGPGLPPGPPPPSQFKRRGTGVPNAEEIAEQNARATLAGRINAARTALTAAGATPDEIESAILGLSGAPRPQRNLSQVAQWGVKIPGSDIVQPVLLDQNKGYVLPGGDPLPPGAQMIRMSGSAGGGALTTRIPDTPEARQYLLAQGVDPAEIVSGSPSGYWKLIKRPDGTVGAQADMYTPPPAYSGTLETTDPNNPRVPVRAPILRQGGLGPPIGDVDQPVKSQTQLSAEALKDAVDEEVRLVMGSTLGRARGVSPAARDAIVAQKAQSYQPPLPYRTYDQIVAAIKGATPISTREREEGGTMAEKVRAAANEARQQQGAQAPAAARPPARPSMRSQGPGPRK